MKRFKEFLREHIEERRLQDTLERIYSILDNDPEAQKTLKELDDLESKEFGESLVAEGTGSPFDDAGGIIYNGGTGEVFGSETGGGDDVIGEGKSEKEKEETFTDTFKFLQSMKKNPPTFDEIKSNFQRFRIKDGQIEERTDKFFGDYKPMTDEQMKDFLDNLNDKNILKRTVYRVDNNGQMFSKLVRVNLMDGSDGEVLKQETPIKNPKVMGSICKLLNISFQDEMPNRLFWWDNKAGSKDKILTITKGNIAKNRNNTDLHDFRDVQYEPVLDKNLQEEIGIILTKARNRTQVKDSSFIGYENGRFTKNGVPMTDKETSAFICTRNGMPNPDSTYWDDFHFLAEGAKIGTTVGSFSLPPGVTCLDGVPCAHQGCYAYRSFRNPSTRACWFSNLAKLQEGRSADGRDRFKQFEDECVKFIADHKLKFFRFHVSGDVDIGANKARYIRAICNIAERCQNIQFWTYTKDYVAWDSVTTPKNLVVLFSAWGKFQPTTKMVNKHPVAFLYDTTDKRIKKYIGKIDPVHFDEYEEGDKDAPVVFCPCSDPAVKETVTCDRCKICYTRSPHHNLAFHKH